MCNSKPLQTQNRHSTTAEVLTLDQLELVVGCLNSNSPITHLIAGLTGPTPPVPPIGLAGPILPIGPGPLLSIGPVIGPVSN